MARLPSPGSDDGTWGTILNDYLLQTHTETGSLKPNIVTTANIADGAITSRTIATNTVSEDLLSADVQTKLNTGGIQAGSITKSQLESAVQTSLDKADTALQTAPVTSVNTRTGAITLTKSDVGLGNVDNTSDASKPVSTATQSALNLKADKTTTEGYWQDYVTTFGGLSLGNASCVAQYRKVGQTVDVMVRLGMGTTTTFDGGTILISLPFAPRASQDQIPVGPAYLRDDSAGSNSRTLAAAVISSGSVFFVCASTPTTVIGTAPWTWAANDLITFNGTYQAS